MDLSIVIVNWNVKEQLEKCLKSIFNLSDNLEFEVVVVDNASSDNSVEMVKKKFPFAVLIDNRDNLGFGAANNQGIKVSKGKYVLLLNPDTIVMPQALKIMIDFIKAHPEVGITGPKILGDDGKIQLTCARSFPTLSRLFFDITTLSKRFPKSKTFGSYSMSYWDHNDEKEISSISGACMLVKKEMIDEIGLFDEKFFMYAEDTDLCMRARKANWKIWYLPKARIIHLGGQSSQIDVEKMTIESHESMYKFFKKHNGIIYAMLFKLLIAFSMLFWNLSWVIYYFLKTEKDKSKIACILKRNNEILNWAILGTRLSRV